MSKPHPHAALMADYAKDAAETETPWERWECGCGSPVWTALIDHPTWNKEAQYRRKPRTIRIGNYDVPEPMREAPVKGDHYWNVDLKDSRSGPTEWRNDSLDREWLALGICHSTQEAAKIHLDALLSFTSTNHEQTH